ncbi:MAG: HAD family hydrolase [Bacteroidales bacterium]|nr:HAD family hydrolase [Bacteroidales bacterium]
MKPKISAALFDMDGVIFDTEPQYTYFWDKIGIDYLGIEDFASHWKGVPVKIMLDKAFGHIRDKHKEILDKCIAFEHDMVFEYIPGAKEFVLGLHERNIAVAIVTSSTERKMSNVYRNHPDFKGMFDHIVTSDNFTKGKPDPECFINGMKILGSKPEETLVFEDSFSGLQAAKASGGIVVGLTTSNPAESIEQYCTLTLADFAGLDVDGFLNSLCV